MTATAARPLRTIGHHHGGPRSPAGEKAPEGGPVLLDIGGEVGALIAYLDDRLIGQELHAHEGCAAATHTGIWPRTLGAAQVTVAVFPGLHAGRWALAFADGTTVGEVDVIGGTVAEIDLR